MKHPKNALVITTIPPRIAGKPPVEGGHSEWILLNGPTKNKVLNAPGYPQPVPKHPGSKPYTVKSTPTMGLGVFATRDIPMGQIIFAERPLIVSPCGLIPIGDINPQDYSREDYQKIMLYEGEQLLEVAARRMEPERRAKLMALMNSHLEDGSGPIRGIIRTNGYGVSNLCDGDDIPTFGSSSPSYYSLVCDVGSRINHRCGALYIFRLANTNLFFSSCLPNVCHAFKPSSFSVVFFALRDIKSGEQLFHSYCAPEQPSSDRKAALAPYGIACVCASCINATPETDTIRQTFLARIKEYRRQSKTWEQLPISPGWNVPVQNLDKLLKYQKALVKEGLDAHPDYWAEFIPALAMAYRWAGRRREMEKVIREMLGYAKFLQEKTDMRKS